MGADRVTVPELAGAVRLLRQRAEHVAAVHRPGIDSWCAGCAQQEHLVFHPCAYARWAADIRHQYAPPPARPQPRTADLDTEATSPGQ